MRTFAACGVCGVAALLLLTGCSSDPVESTVVATPSQSASTTVEGFMTEEAETAAFADELVAKQLSEAKAMKVIDASGYRYRVVARDDEMYPATADYSPTRLNLWIEDGTVVKITVG